MEICLDNKVKLVKKVNLSECLCFRLLFCKAVFWKVFVSSYLNIKAGNIVTPNDEWKQKLQVHDKDGKKILS